MARILVCDDDSNFLEVVGAELQGLGHTVSLTTRSGDVPQMIEAEEFDIVFLDLVMPKGGAVSLIHTVKVKAPNLKVVVWTGRPFMFSSPVMQLGLDTADAKVKKGLATENLEFLIDGLIS